MSISVQIIFALLDALIAPRALFSSPRPEAQGQMCPIMASWRAPARQSSARLSFTPGETALSLAHEARLRASQLVSISTLNAARCQAASTSSARLGGHCLLERAARRADSRAGSRAFFDCFNKQNQTMEEHEMNCGIPGAPKETRAETLEGRRFGARFGAAVWGYEPPCWRLLTANSVCLRARSLG